MQGIGRLTNVSRPSVADGAAPVPPAPEVVSAPSSVDAVDVAPSKPEPQVVETPPPAAASSTASPAAAKVATLRASDRADGLAKHLDTLMQSPAFARLHEGVQNLALDVLAYIERAEQQSVRDATRFILAERGLQTEADGRDHVTRIATLEGFASIEAPAQKKLLLAMCGGGTPHVLLTMLSEKKLAALPADGQAATLAQLARDLPLPTRLEEPERLSIEGKPVYDYGETPYVVPTPDGRQARVTGHAYGVTLGEKVIPVVVPATDPPAQGARFPALLEVVRALRVLPEELREGVEAVTVCPVRKASKNGLDGGALADSGAGGVPGMIRFFASADLDQGVIDATMVHEAGHIRTNAEWGREGRTFSDATPTPGWAAWKTAMDADGIAASGYARVAPTEDFSETLRAAFLFRGTPLEGALRDLMPHRVALVDQLVPSWAPQA